MTITSQSIQIVIPMSGFGERFRRAGYTIPKPLIPVDGIPIITHIMDLFPGETDITVICNQAHLDHPDYQMSSILLHACPTARIVGIPPHQLGPVHAIQQCSIDPHRPVLVNYCDFSCIWDWPSIKAHCLQPEVVGAIPAYRGFHPHSLGPTHYAYLKESNGRVLDIQEKKPFTNDRLREYASSGTYYFKSGSMMNQAFSDMIQANLSVNGEYYVSMAYRPLLQAQHRIDVIPIDYFFQWGTPDDLETFQRWSTTFRGYPQTHPMPPHGTRLFPMAGLGQRFAHAGYTTPKPLLPIRGNPMALQAIQDTPPSEVTVVACRDAMAGLSELHHSLTTHIPNLQWMTLNAPTDGQACTVAAMLKNRTYPAPITIGACDNGIRYDPNAYLALCHDPSIDIIVWGYRGWPHAIRHPHMYGWIREHQGRIDYISVKTPLHNPETDPIVIGLFTFKSQTLLHSLLDQLMAQNHRINEEFYLDSVINLAIERGAVCAHLDVLSYLGWGTPDDYETTLYWDRAFAQWKRHPHTKWKVSE